MYQLSRSPGLVEVPPEAPVRCESLYSCDVRWIAGTQHQYIEERQIFLAMGPPAEVYEQGYGPEHMEFPCASVAGKY